MVVYTFFIDYDTAISENFYNLWLYKQIFLLIPTVEDKLFITIINMSYQSVWRRAFSITWENEHVFIVRSKDPTVLDNQYLFYILNSAICQDQIKRRFHGVVGGINRSDFRTIQIALPPITEQRKIVQILSMIDVQIFTTEKITEKITEKTIELKKGLMQQLLSGKMRMEQDNII